MSVLRRPVSRYRNSRAVRTEIGAAAWVPPVSVATASGVRVHGIQTGWVCIKSQHYHSRVPEALKELAIIADRRWTAPKPILSWVIEHPEGLIVIDSGERSGAKDLVSYLRCADAGSRFFITRNFQVSVEHKSELAPQLMSLGLDPREVRWCIQTHLHFDHANGFGDLPNAEILVARSELEGHRKRPMGAVACKYPPGFAPTLLDYRSEAYGPFGGFYPLTKAGDMLIVPTPGHSYGHQSVIFDTGGLRLFFAGDVVYDERQLFAGELSGISTDHTLTRESMAKTRRFLASHETVFLPSHDPDSLSRLSALQVSSLPAA